MAAYKLYAVVPPLLKFIESLTNWYIRFNRKRFKGEHGLEEAKTAFVILRYLVYQFSVLMAPFAPFFSEHIYQKLSCRQSICQSTLQSVHFVQYPQVKEELIDVEMERAFSRLQVVVERVRTIREGKNISLKISLKRILLLSEDETVKQDL